VEDQTMLRSSLEYLINGQDDMEVIGTAEDAADAPALCRTLQPDMVLMDVVTKNNSNGIVYTAQIRKEFPDIKVVIMTGFSDITFAEEAKKSDAHGFIDKNMTNEHLFFVIRNIMNGMSMYSGNANHQPFSAQFTQKEIDVICMVCQGLSRDDIAKKLDVSEAMVKKHITSILDKTGFDSILRFALYAVGQGLIVPDVHSPNG